MVATIGDLIGEKKTRAYADKMLRVWEIEQMHKELMDAPKKEKAAKLKTLDEAAGYFRGVAAHLRVSG
jgi:hypothetical protein